MNKENQGEQYESKKPNVQLVQCSHCGKNINQKAFEKHVRMCKYASNFTKNKKKVQMDENVQNSDVYLANANNNNTSNKNKSKSSRNVQPDPNDYARNDIDDIPIKPAANKNI